MIIGIIDPQTIGNLHVTTGDLVSIGEDGRPRIERTPLTRPERRKRLKWMRKSKLGKHPVIRLDGSDGAEMVLSEWRKWFELPGSEEVRS